MRDKQVRGEIYEVKKPSPQKKQPPKKPNIFLRLLAFLLTLALMVGAVALVVYRDKFNFDSVRRWFSYRSLEKNDSGQAQSFSHEGSAKDRFAAVGGNLLVCGGSGVRLYSGSGVKYAEQQAVLKNPVASAAGPYALAYDAGGSRLYVFKDREQVFTYDGREDQSILSARLNPSGWLAVTTQASGHKGTVSVYDSRFQHKLNLNLSSLTDALVSQDGKTLAAVTMGQGGAGFESRLSFYRMDQFRDGEAPVPDAACSLGNTVVLDLAESASGYWALGDSSLTAAGRDGAAGVYEYDGRYLKEYSLGGDDFAALVLGKYRAGTVAELVVVDPSGVASASLSLNEQLLSLSAAGRYIAVLTADRLDIYTSDLTLYDTLDGVQGARKVLMRSDGSAILIANDTARLYIPS